MAARFVLNPFGLQQLLASPQGLIAVELTRRALRVESQAKINATGNNGGPHVRTGRLRSSITHRLIVDSQGVAAEVGTNVFYGRYLELGTDRMHPYPFLVPALQAAR